MNRPHQIERALGPGYPPHLAALGEIYRVPMGPPQGNDGVVADQYLAGGFKLLTCPILFAGLQGHLAGHHRRGGLPGRAYGEGVQRRVDGNGNGPVRFLLVKRPKAGSDLIPQGLRPRHPGAGLEGF